MQCIVPLPILEIIIGHIPLEYAVKTRTVSKQWKQIVDNELRSFEYFHYLWDLSPKEGGFQTGLASLTFSKELHRTQTFEHKLSEKQERKIFRLIAKKIHWSFGLEEAKDFNIEFGKGRYWKELEHNWSYEKKFYTIVLRVKDLEEMVMVCVRSDVFMPDDDYEEDEEEEKDNVERLSKKQKVEEDEEKEECFLCQQCHRPLHCPMVQDDSSEEDDDY